MLRGRALNNNYGLVARGRGGGSGGKILTSKYTPLVLVVRRHQLVCSRCISFFSFFKVSSIHFNTSNKQHTRSTPAAHTQPIRSTRVATPHRRSAYATPTQQPRSAYAAPTQHLRSSHAAPTQHLRSTHAAPTQHPRSTHAVASHQSRSSHAAAQQTRNTHAHITSLVIGYL